ncbi:hypothetical protein [Dyadobacter sp. CY312]|nr:hypothetical protein [Dyadobacter sp. CY312]MCE7044468.1 hypothetical protein [Dyadobacter sp. CY312]
MKTINTTSSSLFKVKSESRFRSVQPERKDTDLTTSGAVCTLIATWQPVK